MADSPNIYEDYRDFFELEQTLVNELSIYLTVPLTTRPDAVNYLYIQLIRCRKLSYNRYH